MPLIAYGAATWTSFLDSLSYASFLFSEWRIWAKSKRNINSHSSCSKIEFIRHLTYVFVLVESVCTALLPAPQASFLVQFPVIAWELHRDGIIMVIVWLKFSREQGWWHLQNPPLNNARLYIFHCYPLPIHHPFSPHKNIDHTLRCSAFYGVYNMSVVSVMFLCPSRNDGGLHRNCTLYTRVIRVPSAFLHK